MFDLVPLARPWREVADGHLQACLVRELLQLELPEPHAGAVGAVSVRRDQEPLRGRIERFAHRLPKADGDNPC